MKKAVVLWLLLAAVLILEAAVAERSVQEIEAMLSQACYINTEGGTMVHTVPDCRIVHPKYIPLTKVDYTHEIQSSYSFCPVCCLDEHYGEEYPEESEEPWKEESEWIKSETMEREQQLGMVFNLWNWEQNADFQEEFGHSPSYIARDTDLRRIRPDEHDIPVEEAQSSAVAKLLACDSQLALEKLEPCRLASEYLENDPYLLDEVKSLSSGKEQAAFGESGIWHLTWWDVDDPMEWEGKRCIATAYVDGRTGTVLEIRSFSNGYDEGDMLRVVLP